MDKINIHRINNLRFEGVKVKKPMNIEQWFENTLKKLHDRAQREVPEYGDFKIIDEKFVNPDKNLKVTDFEIKIVNPPKNIEDQEILRGIYITAYNSPSPYKAERLIAAGTKKEILEKLQSKEFLNEILDAAKSLSHSLEDI